MQELEKEKASFTTSTGLSVGKGWMGMSSNGDLFTCLCQVAPSFLQLLVKICSVGWG